MQKIGSKYQNWIRFWDLKIFKNWDFQNKIGIYIFKKPHGIVEWVAPVHFPMGTFWYLSRRALNKLHRCSLKITRRNFLDRTNFQVTERNFLYQDIISCHRTKFHVTKINFLSQKDIFWHLIIIPDTGRIFITKNKIYWILWPEM